MFAFQISFAHAVIFGSNFFEDCHGFLAGRAAEYEVMVTETGDVAFLFMRGRNSAFGSNKAEFFSVLAGDDSCCFQVADNNLFVFAARNGVCAGLGNNFFNREAAVNNFGDTEDVMSAGACNLIFGQRGLVFVPLEYQRFCQVMQCLGSDYDVMADIAVEQAGVGIVNAFGNLQVGRGMGSKAARISMVACCGRLPLYGGMKFSKEVLLLSRRPAATSLL